MSISEFSNETIEKIGYYVYRLIDPRNGETFYVGKGKGNRVFQHVKGVIEQLDKDEKNDNSNDPYKIATIKSILEAGLEVIHVIQRWNLTNKEALEVESALIDCYPGLTNIQSGYGHEYGVCNAQELEQRLSAKEYDEPKDFNYIIIKVTWDRIEYCTEQFGASNARYEATRYRWNNKKPSVKQYPYVFSVTNGIVKEVYSVHDWYDAGDNRIAFNGALAPKDISDRFIGKKIPECYRKKGMAAPFLKSKN